MSKFELESLKVNNIKELDGWVEQQKALVTENPFIEITDNKTYTEAKKRRTAYVKGRRSVEKQDSLLATVLKNFRNQLGTKKVELVGITKPHEEKQQTEVERWESKLKEESEKKANKEKERIRLIESKIEEFKANSTAIIVGISFENIENSKTEFKKLIENQEGFDFQEYKYTYDQLINEVNLQFDQSVSNEQEKEKTRLDQLEEKTTGRINEFELAISRMIDEATLEEEGLKSKIENAINQDSFDYGDQWETYVAMTERMIGKAQEKMESLRSKKIQDDELKELRLIKENQNKLKEQRSRIEQMENGYLDIIHQINTENHIVQTKVVMDGLVRDNGLLEDLFPNFETMCNVVKKALKERLESVSKELEEKRLKEDEVFQEKINQIQALGFAYSEKDDVLIAYGIEVRHGEIKNSSSFVDYINGLKDKIEEVNQKIQKTKSDEERSKRLLPEKESMFNYLDSVFTFEIDSYTDKEEMKPLLDHIQNDYENFTALIKERINSF